MNKISRMRRSRDRWKSKATDRAEQLREFRKTKARQQRKIGHLQARVNALEEQRSQEKKPTFQETEVVSLREASQIRTVCVVLVLQAVVSFRAVPRILQLLWRMGHLSLQWVPHFTSVINWTLRLGLAALSEVAPRATPWLAIIDHSIDIGVKKALVVLRVPIEALARRGSAIQLEDCECIGLRVSEHTDGETVAGALTEIFSVAGDPVAIVKDGGSDLGKGVALWKQREGKKFVWNIEDIGHVMANVLKGQFEKTAAYQRFIALIYKGSARLRQTPLAFLIPPKLRTKGRFQSISKLGAWAEKILTALAVRGRAEPNSALAKLRAAMPGLAGLRPFIERFACTVQTVAEVLEILKNKGLNQQTYAQCRQLAEKLPPRSKAKKRLVDWLNRHLHVQCRLGISPLPLRVSSDIIESLFGKFKHIIERSPQADMNRTTLLIPALCGQVDAQAIALALAHVTHRDLQRWERQHIPYTLRQRRRAFFDAIGDQKPGIPEFL
jgi:hypothetical protein